MTTATRLIAPGFTGLAWGAAAAAAAGAAIALVGALTGGSAAALSAGVGTLMVVGLIVLGVSSVVLVASTMPDALVLVSLLMFAATVVAAVAVFVGLRRSDLLTDGTLEPGWLAASVVAVAVAWCIGQIVAGSRVRRPLYDLPEAGA